MTVKLKFTIISYCKNIKVVDLFIYSTRYFVLCIWLTKKFMMFCDLVSLNFTNKYFCIIHNNSGIEKPY